MENIKIKKLRPDALTPACGSEYAAGADLYACMDRPVTVAPGDTQFIGTGLAMELPTGYVGLIFARSGLACKQDLAPANKVGVLDSDYRGEVCIALHNHGKAERIVEPGERIAQLVLIRYETVCFTEADTLEDTARGAGGFGSTGK